MKTSMFSDFIRGVAWLTIAIFFSTSTCLLVFFADMAIEKIPRYEALWTHGWNDWHDIAESVQEISVTSQRLSVLIPDVVHQMDEINNSMNAIDKSVCGMEGHVGDLHSSVVGLEESVKTLSVQVPSGMVSMNNNMQNMTPGGWMKKIPMGGMMPW